MYKVGAIDIDTSHPIEFAKIMRESKRGVYTCVYNNGFRDDSYVQKFMRDNEISVRCNKLDEMIELVDIVFIHSCNWDKHIELAEPFIKAGKPVFIDKPIVGNINDCNKLQDWVDRGAKILGGSAFRYCNEFNEFLQKPVNERGEILSMFGTIGVDEFSYGIHVIESFGCFIPTGAQSVRVLHENKTQVYQIKYNDNIHALYQFCPGAWRPTKMSITTTQDTVFITPDINMLYVRLLNSIFDTLDGFCPYPNIRELLESIKIAFAGLKSKQLGGQEVKLSELDCDCPAYDGAIYEKHYTQANSK